MAMCFCVVFAMAQKPQKNSFTYEVRNASGELAASGTSVTVSLNVYKNGGTTADHTESATATVNGLGQITVKLTGTHTWDRTATYVLKPVVTSPSGYQIQNSDVPLIIGTMADSTSVANRYGTMIRLSRVATSGSYTDLTNRPDSALRAEMENNNDTLLAKIKADSTFLHDHIDSTASNIRTELFKGDSTQRAYTDTINKKLLAKIKSDSTSLRTHIDSTAANIRTEKADKATTLSGYNISDAYISGTKIVLGTDTISVSTSGEGSDLRDSIAAHRKNIDTLFKHTTKAALRDSVKGQINDSLAAHKVVVFFNGTAIDSFRLTDSDSIPINVNVKDTTERFTATDGQTEFTLQHAPLEYFSVKLYINGVFICDVREGSTSAISVGTGENSKKVTYTPANNGSKTLEADDRVQIVYSYR